MASNTLKCKCVYALSLAILVVPFTWAAEVKSAVNDEDVVLVRNSLTTVTKADFFMELRRLPEDYRGGVLLSETNIVKTLDGILLNKSLAVQARQLKIDSEPEVKQAFQWMMEKGLAQMRMERLIKEAGAEFTAKQMEFEPRAKEIYKTSPEKFTEKAAASAAHILIGLDKRSKQEALKLAQEVRKLALEGKPFDELATQYSDDPSAKTNKGDLGTFTAGKMVKPFEDAAFALAKPGDISEPVETQFGFHIIRLQDKKPDRLKPFDEVRSAIMEEMKEQYINQKRSEHVAKINSDTGAIVNKEAVATLKQAPLKLDKATSEAAKK